MGTAALGMLTVDLDFKPPAKELLKDIKSIFRNLELVVFFLVIFSSGILITTYIPGESHVKLLFHL